jgi:signal transduction histidine kinase/ligand-binding sensor domain-containing protein
MSRSSLSGSSTCRSAGRRRALAGVLALAAAVAIATSVQALDATRAISQYMRDHWGSESGFPGGPVYAITQTSDGYLWIGAEKGLVRFDGVTFQLMDAAMGVHAGPAVLGVAGAADGSVWARLRGIGLVRHRAGRLDNLLGDQDAPRSVVTAMARGKDGVMLLATLAHGAMAYRGGRFDPITVPGALPSFVISIAETANGELWLGSRDAGIVRVRGTQVTRQVDGLPDLKVNCLLATPDGGVWIGTDRGMARWNGTEITQAGVPAALRATPALALTRDRESNLWVAAGARGLLRVSPDGSVHAAAEAGWSLGHVAATFEDRDGNLWVGTDRGIERWRDPLFTTFAGPQGLPPDAGGPIHAAADGRVWFGPSSGGLFWIRDGQVHEVTEAGLSQDVIYSIHGGGGEVWVGRQRGGVTVLRVGDGGITAERYTQRDGLAQDSVFAIHRTRDGSVWAGTLSAGASLLTRDRPVTYDTRSGLPSNTVASLLEAGDGTMWFGTPNGLAARSARGWRTYTTADGLPSNDVTTLFEDRAGVLWVGTAKGVALVQNGAVTSVGTSAPDLRRSILAFAEDGRGWLWIHATDEILRVRRQALAGDTLQPGDVRHYGVADGLLGVDSVKRHRIVTQDGQGRIWFALTRGLSMADPARADGRVLPALTHVEQLTADGVSVDMRGPIRLPSGRRRIAVGYAGLSLAVPERVRFRYRLDGFDREWSEPVAERQAVYTNLGPGPYRFRVIASNSDGLWNGTESSLAFEILPLVWQTAWFQLAAVACTGLAGWGLYGLRVRQVSRRLNARFEERLAERTRIAQELHDTLLQGFMSASLQLHVAVDGLPEASPARASLGRVHDLMRRVIDEGRNAVRGLRSSTIGPLALEQAFAGVQQEVGASAATYRVIVEGRPRELKPMIRDEVYRIAREGLVNAFRHSGATHVELELEYGAKELHVLVRDDGRGIDPQVVRSGTDGHWGITGMRERAERIGATLKIRSRAEAGTELELRVPGPVAFERQSSRWLPWRNAASKRSPDVAASPTRTEKHS